MRACSKNLSAFQLRSMRQVGGMLAACVAVTTGVPALTDNNHLSATTHFVLGLLAVIPIIGTMIVIARYLAGETDEYLRSLVVRSILWGFGIVMVADTLLCALVEYHPNHLPFGLLNMDIFVVTSMIALRLQLWSNA
jgi:hypothetical protein